MMTITGGMPAASETTGELAWQVLRDTRVLVDRSLRVAVDRLAEPTRTMAGYHFGWWDAHGNPAGGGGTGKALRPALVRLCVDAVGAAPDAARAVAVAHNFTLLHDDVMDRDELRHHRRAVWSVFGVPAAILTGDALLVLALDVLAECSAPQSAQAVHELCRALVSVVDGQAADMAFERRVDVGLDECVAMAGNKTAALLGCACGVGALIGGADPVRVDHLRWFGFHLGLAFQLVDDLLGIWGASHVTGKPRGADLRVGKKSLPVVAALTFLGEASHRFAQLYLHGEPLTDADVVVATDLIEQAGGHRWAQDETNRQLAAAPKYLHKADPAQEAAVGLVALAQLITARDR